MPSRGPLAGINLLVVPVQRLQQEDEGRIKWKDGALTVVPKTKKYFSFYHFNEFYEHLVRQVQRSTTGILLDGYDQPRQTTPEDAGGGKGKGKGTGSRGRGRHGGSRGRGGVADACYGHDEGNCRHQPNCHFRHVCTACGADGHVRGDPACPGGVLVVTPDPMVEADAAWELGETAAVEVVDAVDAQVESGLPDVEDGGGVSSVAPGGADIPGRWWADLRADEFVPVWDVLGGPRRHDRAPMVWEVERLAPLPVTQLSPETWVSTSEPWRTRFSTRWPASRAEILRRATVENMEACGKSEGERRCYEEECERVGCAIPTLTSHAHLVAAAFRDWHDVDFLVRCAACGAGWPSEEIAIDEQYRVPNYAGPEHMDVIRVELRRESEAGHIFLAGWRLPLGVITLGVVEKVRKGKVKYRPVSDYSRPADVGVNARIKLQPDEFTTVKEAYGMLRPGYLMVKVDMEAAYRSVGIANMFWPHQCFEFDDVMWMDARAPFGNRALPGIFMRWTRAIVVLEFLGVLLDTSGGVCMASIDEERIAVVVRQAGELKAQAARDMVSRRALESLLGLLAFCSHVVWGLSLYTRRGFNFLAATVGRKMVRLPHQVLEDLTALEQVVRQYNGKKVVLERRLVDERHCATDASGTLGFGGVWERLFFMLSWANLARMSGHTVVVNIDNQSAMHQKFDGHNAWGNLPFSIMCAIINNFLRCKRRQQWGTAAYVLVPVWDGDEGLELVKSLPHVFRVEDGAVVWVRHWVPLRAVPGSLMCPVRAVMRLMERTAGQLGDSALFVMEKPCAWT
ncbi:hypothetical protein CYMTET_34665 [Cymbomonas tetramitiformis]|uniref:Uncharacterized protein n=1 Tax=Cymbomonas tetramitiformis TaxID=36881 RepID=A0AAE0KPZ8_9CHLO|nr:hypothetical protein CYMTET_34665 [Cymbomonas tetramitiformis]